MTIRWAADGKGLFVSPRTALGAAVLQWTWKGALRSYGSKRAVLTIGKSPRHARFGHYPFTALIRAISTLVLLTP